MSNLPESQQKDEYGNCFVKALATSCRYDATKPSTDYDSIDLIISCGDKPRKDSILSSCKLEIQLKSYSIGSHCFFDHKKQCFKVKLSTKNYNDLRKTSGVPRILVVYLLPENKKYIQQGCRATILYGRGYWASLADTESTPNKKTKTIEIPIQNRFNKKTLERLIYLSSLGHRSV